MESPTVRKFKLSVRSRQNAVHVAALSMVAMMAAEPAFAQTAGGGALAPLQAAVDFVVSFLTGAFGRAIAILAFIFLGFLALMGRITVMQAGFAVLGIGLIFGATQIVDTLQGAVGG